LWSDGSTGNSYSASHPQLIELQASNGCGTTTYQWNVNPLDCLETIYIPSSFTPNGDGINDVWYPVNGNNYIHSIQIFNRWGELIFQGDENSKIWIGNDLQGKYYVPDGTYTYTIKITQNTIETREIKGHIVLIR
jgi:gliding motility-associated-like protein